MPKVALGRRSAVVTLLYWGLVIVGLVLFLINLIIALVYIGKKDPVFAHWLYWYLLSFHYVAFGANLSMLFGTVLFKRAGGILDQSLILSLLYLLALIFDILAGIYYGILGFEACQGKNQDQVEAGICDHQQWVVWVLWILIIILIIHAAVGIIAGLLDRFMRRAPSGGEELGSPVQTEGMEGLMEDLEKDGYRYSGNPSYSSGGITVLPSNAVLYAPVHSKTSSSTAMVPTSNGGRPRPDYAYVTKGE